MFPPRPGQAGAPPQSVKAPPRPGALEKQKAMAQALRNRKPKKKPLVDSPEEEAEELPGP